MNNDDIIYLSLLFFSIAFGYYYRTIKDVEFKKNLGTAIGILIVFIVSGVHVLHLFFTVFINILIILLVDKRKCHLISFIFTFSYLLFFRSTIYFGIPYPPAHTNLVQMMLTLKLVGLAFELNETNEQKQCEKNAEIEANLVEPNCIDIIHYSFNYIGVLTGPYYRYRTFIDYMNYPFGQYADWKKATFDKMKYIPLYAISYLLASYYWPSSYATSDEFYQRSWLYRYWFIWPNFFVFRMRLYIGLILSECVCTMAGLGAYPDCTKPKAGQGPSENFDEMKKLLSHQSNLEQINYDFKTIKNVSTYGSEFCTTYREGMKHWNMCIQYWLAVNVYKRFPSKKYRTLVTTLVSSYWHGIYLGYYVCIGTAPLPLLLEDVYYKLFLKEAKGSFLKIYEWIHWFFKMHFFSYQAIAFTLLQVNLILHFYNSIYHAGLVVWIIMYLAGVQMLRAKKRKEKLVPKNE